MGPFDSQTDPLSFGSQAPITDHGGTMANRRSAHSNQLRSFLALCVLAATPAATCGITLGALALRVQTIESSHWIVVDAEGREIGSVVDPGSVLIRRDGFKPLLVYAQAAGPGLPFSLYGSSGLFFESTDCSGTPYLLASNSISGAAFFDPDLGLVGEIEGSTRAPRTLYSIWDWQDNRCYAWAGGNLPGISVEGALVEGFEAVPPLRLVTLAEHNSGETGQ